MAKTAITPMMAQYIEIKAGHQDALLFYRMGDFYELFFEDAAKASAALDIALTTRGKHLGEDIPMCGVPVHAAETYLLTLIRKGFRVAIAEQMEGPAEARKRGSRALVRRKVVRVVTPGTLTEDSLLTARKNNYLAAIACVRDEMAVAWSDISTGSLRVVSTPANQLATELARLSASEVLLPEGLFGQWASPIEELGGSVTTVPGSTNSLAARQRLEAHFRIASIDGFGAFGPSEIVSLGLLVDYLETTQQGSLPRLQFPVRERREHFMAIDAATRRNLELTERLAGGREGSLLSTIDWTVTPAGARLLEQRVKQPCIDLSEIRERQDAIAAFVDANDASDRLAKALGQTPDLHRALARLSLDRGGPKDLAAVRDSLFVARSVAETDREGPWPERVKYAFGVLKGENDLLDRLERVLVDQPGTKTADGGFIRDGVDSDLDDARLLKSESRAVIAGLQSDYADETGIQSLKIKYNNVLGYFIETTSAHARSMLDPSRADRFIHRQTTANAVRFTTRELSETEARIATASETALTIETEYFAKLRDEIIGRSGALSAIADAMAELDWTVSLARLSLTLGWCRPEVDDSKAFEVLGGRHPVVEAALDREGKRFVPNDCMLSDSDGAAIWLVTGPNMAGKSTFLRQNALILILAQMGSFVPAHKAKIGVATRLFSRVGAADDLSRGRSTFMVEMVETASILNQADERSFVILDEIGRGTATHDGLSIAWATLEYLHEQIKCRAHFATHYQELGALVGQLGGVSAAHFRVSEKDGEIVFLHEVCAGQADRSYGVHVARLAGLPDKVVDRADQVLQRLDSARHAGGTMTALAELPLFADTVARDTGDNAALDRLERVDPDTLSPREALALVYELKETLLSSPVRS